jgi:Tfp pilus assembly protein PilV
VQKRLKGDNSKAKSDRLKVTSNPRQPLKSLISFPRSSVVPGENAFQAPRVTLPNAMFMEGLTGRLVPQGSQVLGMDGCTDSGDSDASMDISESGEGFLTSTPRLLLVANGTAHGEADGDIVLRQRYDTMLATFHDAGYDLHVSSNDVIAAVKHFERITSCSESLSPWTFVPLDWNPRVFDIGLLAALKMLVEKFQDRTIEKADFELMKQRLMETMRFRVAHEKEGSVKPYLIATDAMQVVMDEDAEQDATERAAITSPSVDISKDRPVHRKCAVCKKKAIFGTVSTWYVSHGFVLNSTDSSSSNCLDDEKRKSEMFQEPFPAASHVLPSPGPKTNPTEGATVSEKTMEAPEKDPSYQWMFQERPHQNQIRKVVQKKTATSITDASKEPEGDYQRLTVIVDETLHDG